jgi:hypothetical protein
MEGGHPLFSHLFFGPRTTIAGGNDAGRMVPRRPGYGAQLPACEQGHLHKRGRSPAGKTPSRSRASLCIISAARARCSFAEYAGIDSSPSKLFSCDLSCLDSWSYCWPRVPTDEMRAILAGRVECALQADKEPVHHQGWGQAQQLEGHEGVRPRVWVPDEGLPRRGGDESSTLTMWLGTPSRIHT